MASNSIDNAGDCAEARRRGRDPSRGRWALLALGLLLAGCLVPAPEEPIPPKARFLMINPANVDPAPVAIATISRNEVAGKQFEIGVPLASDITTTIRYFWYYDYDPGGPGPEYYGLCPNSDERCLLRVCLKLNPQAENHQMLVVVADQKLNENPKSPFDFPPGTLFDSVHWSLKLTGSCPTAAPLP